MDASTSRADVLDRLDLLARHVIPPTLWCIQYAAGETRQARRALDGVIHYIDHDGSHEPRVGDIAFAGWDGPTTLLPRQKWTSEQRLTLLVYGRITRWEPHTLEGEREILGLWWQDTEGAKFWLAVLNDLHQRGVGDVLIACVDGLTGFPEAIAAVFPQAWVQTCIVHMIRASMRYVSYADRKRLMPDLRRVYSAPNAEEAARQLELFDEKWGERYPMVAQTWRARWEHVIPFLALPTDLRRVVYTTNAIEGLNRQVRKAIKTRGHFPDEQAATKLIYLALMRAETNGSK